jgi:hypothetical protein
VEKDLELVRRCLTLISRIAARGACSTDDEHVFDTLMELRVALHNPRVSPTKHQDIERVHHELDFIDSTSQPLMAELILKCSTRSTWN